MQRSTTTKSSTNNTKTPCKIQTACRHTEARSAADGTQMIVHVRDVASVEIEMMGYSVDAFMGPDLRD